MPTCKLEIRSVYGTTVLYPACETSQKFASLLGTRTIPRRAAEIIESLGFKIEASGAALDWHGAK